MYFTSSINGEGGNMRGIELVYQQNFANGFGISSDYSYTASNIKEAASVGNPFPIKGLMRHNGGVMGRYEKDGFEARPSVNHHSPVPRTPGWTAGALISNNAESWVSTNVSTYLTRQIQVHFGIENLTNQKVVYTSANNPASVNVNDDGRRYNAGVAYKFWFWNSHARAACVHGRPFWCSATHFRLLFWLFC